MHIHTCSERLIKIILYDVSLILQKDFYLLSIHNRDSISRKKVFKEGNVLQCWSGVWTASGVGVLPHDGGKQAIQMGRLRPGYTGVAMHGQLAHPAVCSDSSEQAPDARMASPACV